MLQHIVNEVMIKRDDRIKLIHKAALGTNYHDYNKLHPEDKIPTTYVVFDEMASLGQLQGCTAEIKNQNIASSYVGITQKEQFRKKVSALSGIKVSQLGSIVATQNEDMPTFVDIKVVASSPEITKKVVEAAPQAFNEELINLVKSDCVEVVYEPTTPRLIPRGKDFTLLKCLGVAIVLSIFLVLLVECLDTKIKTPKDVEKYWDLPLLGVIPMDDKKVKGAHTAKNGGRR